MQIDLVYFEGCPHAAAVRERRREALVSGAGCAAQAHGSLSVLQPCLTLGSFARTEFSGLPC